MCGILGILANKGPISNLLYDGLLVLQHRGQDAAGIVVCDEDKFHLRKDNGLVNDVFQKEHIHNLRGKTGIAHVRYPTAGTASAAVARSAAGAARRPSRRRHPPTSPPPPRLTARAPR